MALPIKKTPVLNDSESERLLAEMEKSESRTVSREEFNLAQRILEQVTQGENNS